MNTVVKKDCEEIAHGINNILSDLAGKTFLIAGVTSFLGSNIANFLLYYNSTIAKNEIDRCRIYGLYRSEEKLKQLFENQLNDNRFYVLRWDATAEAEIVNIETDVDYIFYLCSVATTDMFRRHPVETVKTNTIGLEKVLEFAKTKKAKGVLFFSSGAIYGAPQGRAIEIHENDMWPIDHLDNNIIYAESKRVGETLCKAFYDEYNVPVKIVRISHTYGPGIDINDGRVFSDFVKNIVNRENLLIRGDGTATRPFCYITDAVSAFFLILFRGKAGEAYNMANPEETYSIGELAEKLAFEAFPERGLKPVYLSTKGNTHIDKVIVNVDKLRSIGWNYQVNVADGFRRVVESIEE